VPVIIGAKGTNTVPTITTTINGVLHFSAKTPTTAVNSIQQLAPKP
jgi:hypothetical protein